MNLSSKLRIVGQWAGKGLVAAAIAFVISLVGWLIGMYAKTDRLINDLRTTWTSTHSSGLTVMIGVDERTIDEHGDFRIDRAVMAKVLKQLAAAGTERIFLDSALTSATQPDSDAALEAALAELGPDRVALPMSTLVANPEAQNAMQGVGQFPLARFASHATIVSSDIIYDGDGYSRNVGRAVPLGLPQEPSVASWLAHGSDATPGNSPVDYGVEIDSIPTFSLLDVEQQRVPPGLLEGKRVIIGLAAKGLMIPVFVPRYGAITRIESFALGAETQIQNRDLTPVPWWAFLLGTAVISLLMGRVLPGATLTFGMLLVVVMVVVQFTASIGLQLNWKYESPLGLPIISTIMTFVCVMVATDASFHQTRCVISSLVDKVDLSLVRLFNSGTDAIITFSPDGRILTVNNTAEKLFGFTAKEVLGKPLSTVLPDSAESLLRSASCHQPGRLCASVADTEGQSRHVDLAFNAMPSETGWVGFVSIRDITELKVRQDELLHQASHDAMTGLPNRAAFQQHLSATLEYSRSTHRPFAVFLMDLNKFKQVNDTLGHHVGDALLIEVAKRFREALRDGDFVARLGGDEFAVVLAPPSNLVQASAVAEMLVQQVGSLKELDGHAIETGTSIGIALYPEHADQSDALLRVADEAMYVAKRAKVGFEIAKPAVKPIAAVG